MTTQASSSVSVSKTITNTQILEQINIHKLKSVSSIKTEEGMIELYHFGDFNKIEKNHDLAAIKGVVVNTTTKTIIDIGLHSTLERSTINSDFNLKANSFSESSKSSS